MCDGVTQGQRGMELSLFSRDTIALSTAIALGHGMFEGAALLGICDKIVPGLLIGGLRFGHLPTILVPAGPGTGVKAGPGVREVVQLAGIRNILTKVHGSSNPINLVKATIAGLQQLRTREEVARLRGVSL